MNRWCLTGLYVSLKSEESVFAFARRVQEQWLKAAFAPRDCARILEHAAMAANLPQAHYDVSEIARGGRPATGAMLFDAFERPRDWQFHLAARQGGLSVAFDVAPAETRGAVEIVRALGAVQDRYALEARLQNWADDDLVGALVKGVSDDGGCGQWAYPRQPGIYRREHACLVLRSRTTTIVVDPQRLAPGWTTNGGRSPSDVPLLRADGVLVTHGHEDHWHLPSILSLVESEAPVLVPKVPACSLLSSEDLFASLERCGQRVEAPEWGATTWIGDFRVDVVPFFGEQPTRDGPPLELALRNWGNCYRLECAEFSVLILVDSGVDPLGDTVDAVRLSTEARGPVDVVLSCCLEFPEAINAGLAEYLFALPFGRVRQIYTEQCAGRVRSITAGPDGVADACAAARARHFLPYAHGFAGLGVDPLGDGELRLTRRLVQRLATHGVATRAHIWSPGDAFVPSGGGRVARYAELPI